MEKLRCPVCKSSTISELHDNILCLHCGYSEPLYDYPVHDPAWERPPEVPSSNIEERLLELEQKISEPSSIPKYYRDRTQRLEGQVAYLQQKLDLLLSKRKPLPKSEYKGIEL